MAGIQYPRENDDQKKLRREPCGSRTAIGEKILLEGTHELSKRRCATSGLRLMSGVGPLASR